MTKDRQRLAGIWYKMKLRCFYRYCPKYKIYGGRGITVCKEWMDFKNFYNWAINNGYSFGLSIDRIDNNGNYCPENCRWATPKEQARNRRNNFYIEHNGERKLLVDWEEETGISASKLYTNFIKFGEELAFCGLSLKGRVFRYENKYYDTRGICNLFSIKIRTFQRKSKKLGINEIFKTDKVVELKKETKRKRRKK